MPLVERVLRSGQEQLGYQFAPAADAGFGEDVAEVLLCRVRRNAEQTSDSVCGMPPHDELNNLLLALAQPVDR